ncbi:MAG: Rrf2 family transcriptional regulator [Rhodothermaceae bacterium]|nr:Rrf2 family transcriptional regulator [Rhodothermaceae bacterium]
MLSKSCEYGLRAALHLASVAPGTYVPIRDVSTALGIPYHFLAKIAQAMIQQKILASTRGPHGGVRLARAADQITLNAIVLALDGPAIFEECVLGLPGCGTQQPCPLHDQWAPARERVRAMFVETTLDELATRIQTQGFRLADLTSTP